MLWMRALRSSSFHRYKHYCSCTDLTQFMNTQAAFQVCNLQAKTLSCRCHFLAMTVSSLQMTADIGLSSNQHCPSYAQDQKGIMTCRNLSYEAYVSAKSLYNAALKLTRSSRIWSSKFLRTLMQNGRQKPMNELRQDVALRYRALEQFTKEDVRIQFLRLLRGFAYGGYCCSHVAVFRRSTSRHVNFPQELWPMRVTLDIYAGAIQGTRTDSALSV